MNNLQERNIDIIRLNSTDRPTIHVNTENGGVLERIAFLSDLYKKQDTLISGVNIKTINGNPILGEGNIVISGGGSSIGVINNAYSSSTTDALSANMGRILQNQINTLPRTNSVQMADIKYDEDEEVASISLFSQESMVTSFFIKSDKFLNDWRVILNNTTSENSIVILNFQDPEIFPYNIELINDILLIDGYTDNLPILTRSLDLHSISDGRRNILFRITSFSVDTQMWEVIGKY